MVVFPSIWPRPLRPAAFLRTWWPRRPVG
jgi:hypothetical protein